MSASSKTKNEVDKSSDGGVEVLDNELSRLLPDGSPVLKLEDGTEVAVRPLKLKELFAAFKVITRGSAMTFGAISPSLFSDASEEDQFVQVLIGLLINAIPEADVEFCEFIRVCVDSVSPALDGKWASREEKDEAEAHLDELLLENPEIGDALSIVTAVVVKEAKDIQKLGKKVGDAIKIYSKVTPKK